MMQVSAPAKIILVGEHAVVYGQPAIALPVMSLYALATVEQSASPLSIIANDLNRQQIEFTGDDPLAIAARLTLETLGVAVPNLQITVESHIPIASGLGSGAAISTVIVKALCAALGYELDKAQINQIVYEVEKLHHGTPSGIDNTVIVYEQAIYFVRNQPIQLIYNKSPLHLLIADTGKGALTKIAVGDVRKLYESETERISRVIEQIGELVQRTSEALKEGNIALLGQLMLENHAYLKELTVSSEELDRLVEAAMHAGAFGAKLSGGGRGGNMIALVSDETREPVKAALLVAGAVNVIETIVEANNS